MDNKNISVHTDQIKNLPKKIKLKDLGYSIQKISTSPNSSRIAHQGFLHSLLPSGLCQISQCSGMGHGPYISKHSSGFAADVVHICAGQDSHLGVLDWI